VLASACGRVRVCLSVFEYVGCACERLRGLVLGVSRCVVVQVFAR
jgi:hypothetical protein